MQKHLFQVSQELSLRLSKLSPPVTIQEPLGKRDREHREMKDLPDWPGFKSSSDFRNRVTLGKLLPFHVLLADEEPQQATTGKSILTMS